MSFLPKKIVGLDILRFSMALMMVIYHIQTNLNNSILNYLNLNGFYGTSVFFILSGFILAHVYSKDIEHNNFSNINFLIKRFNSLFPIHIFTLLVSIFVTIALIIITNKSFPLELNYQTVQGITTKDTFEFHIKDMGIYILKSIFLVQAWESNFLFFNGASWSVSALFFFYLCFFYFTSWVVKQNKLILILFFIWISAMLYPLYLIITNNFSPESIGILHRNPLVRLPDFLAGVTFYFICINYKYNEKYMLPCLFFSFIGFITIYFFVKNSPYIGFSLSHNGLFLFTQLALIYFFLGIKISNTKTITLIERLGKASLTIYMLHLPLLNIYFIAYKLIVSFPYSNSFGELIINAKSISHLSSIGVLIFFIFLIPLSIIMQERIFTPLQLTLNKKLIRFRKKYSTPKIENI